MDNLTDEQRRKNMRHIKSNDTQIEVILRKALWSHGYRYRKNYKKLPGKPDIVMTKHKIAIFCDSEFFHGKDWPELEQRLKRSNNSEYWIKKIYRNIQRDKEVNEALENLGWTVLRFWGNDIKKDVAGCIKSVDEAVFNQRKDSKEIED